MSNRICLYHKKYKLIHRDRERAREKKNGKKSHIEKRSSGKIHFNWSVGTEHWLYFVLHASFAGLLQRIYVWMGVSQRQHTEEEKNQLIWNVFIHLCQVNEHGIRTVLSISYTIQRNTHTTVASLALYEGMHILCLFSFILSFPSHAFIFLDFLEEIKKTNCIYRSMPLSFRS